MPHALPFALSALLCACAAGNGTRPPPPDAAVDAALPQDDAPPSDDAAPEAAPQQDARVQEDRRVQEDAPPGTCATLLINELQVIGVSDADEFIEVAGRPGTSLAGYRLVFRAPAGTMDVNVFAFSAADTIPASGFLVVASSAWTGGTPDKTYVSAGGILSAAGGGVALRQGAADTGTVIDSVGYDSSTHNAFVEGGVPVAAPGANQSASRTPNCRDTDNNHDDFQIGTPTPGH
jgi:hypothetical protein